MFDCATKISTFSTVCRRPSHTLVSLVSFPDPENKTVLSPPSSIPASLPLSPQNPETHEVTDMFSFYHLPSTVMHHPVHKVLNVAYAFYNVSTVTHLKDLMLDALIIAKQVSLLDEWACPLRLKSLCNVC